MKKQPKVVTSKVFTLWMIVFFISMLVINSSNKEGQIAQQINYSQFIKAVENGHVKEVTFQGENTIKGKFKDSYISDKTKSKFFWLTGNTGEQTYNILAKNKITPNYEKQPEPSLIKKILIGWGPMILMILLLYFFMRQLQGGGGKAMSFGKSKAKVLSPSSKKVVFKDVAGVEEAKEELVEVVDFLKDSKKYTNLGGKIPKGVMLVGPPGTGKTLLARAVAGEAGVPFFSISGSDFVEMFVGVGASRVRDLFEQAKKSAPCIVFIDEIDAVGRHRGAGHGGGNDEREQTLNQLLVEMDGFESNEGIIIMAATNRIDVLDPALLRPGRFDRRVTVGKPDVRGRLSILKVHTHRTPLSSKIDLELIARGTPGFTGADIANLVNEAALSAARQGKKFLENEDFEYAKDKVLMGVPKKSMVISDNEKRNTAFHEAGHTLVGMYLPKTDPIHKVSVIPRGGALGVTQTLPDEDMVNLSKERAENFIAFLMGGRVAEELVFDEMTSGASNDIERATSLARNMVCSWGMSKEMGPIMYSKNKEHAYASGGDNKEFSDDTAKKIDIEVRDIIDRNYEVAKKILIDNRDALDRLSEALIIWETLDYQQIKDIVDGKDIGLPVV
jgi:cell division protease FtsH